MMVLTGHTMQCVLSLARYDYSPSSKNFSLNFASINYSNKCKNSKCLEPQKSPRFAVRVDSKWNDSTIPRTCVSEKIQLPCEKDSSTLQWRLPFRNPLEIVGLHYIRKEESVIFLRRDHLQSGNGYPQLWSVTNHKNYFNLT